MKLEGLRRVNRSARAGEVLRTPEQPRHTVWDPRDPGLFSRLLREAQTNGGFHRPEHLGYMLFDLGVMQPGPANSEQRVQLVKELVEQMKAELKFSQKVPQHPEWALAKLKEHLLPALLLDPGVKFKAPKQFWDQVHSSIQTEDGWYRDTLRVYSLLFPGRLDPLKDQIVEFRKSCLTNARTSNPEERGHNIAAEFATVRLVAPDRFSELEMTSQDRRDIQTYLEVLRKTEVEEWEQLAMYPENVFLAMVALADEVFVSQDNGLQLEFTAPVIAPTPELPERPRF